jgi:hypothetical protein
METSEQVNELFASLALAQGDIETVTKTAENTFFKKGDKGSPYATLADCVKVTHKILSTNKLCLIQGVHGAEFVARLGHASGQWLQVRIPIPGDLSKMNAQQLGAATTYLRRQTYSLVGLAPDEDDDGNEAAKAGTFKGRPANGWDHKPIGDTVDDTLARLYASNFKAAFENDDVFRAKEIHSDLHSEGEEAYRNAWALLDSKTRTWAKKAIAMNGTAQ